MQNYAHILLVFFGDDVDERLDDQLAASVGQKVEPEKRKNVITRVSFRGEGRPKNVDVVSGREKMNQHFITDSAALSSGSLKSSI